MNYGYDATVKGWKRERQDQLAADLSELVQQFEDRYQMHPYVEVDELYQGVRIRRITHLTDEQTKSLVKQADAIFEKVMGNGRF